MLQHAKSELLTVSAAATLSHITRLAPKTCLPILKKLTLKGFCTLLRDSAARIQQALVSIFNVFVINNTAFVNKELFQEKSLIPTLL